MFEPKIIAQAQFFHCSRGNGADENVKFGRNSCPPILAMKKLGVLLLVSSIEYFDHLLVKNCAGNGFVKSFFLVYPSLKMQILIFLFFVRAKNYCTGSVFSLLKRKRCWWDCEIRSKQLSTYPCNEKTGSTSTCK